MGLKPFWFQVEGFASEFRVLCLGAKVSGLKPKPLELWGFAASGYSGLVAHGMAFVMEKKS